MTIAQLMRNIEVPIAWIRVTYYVTILVSHQRLLTWPHAFAVEICQKLAIGRDASE